MMDGEAVDSVAQLVKNSDLGEIVTGMYIHHPGKKTPDLTQIPITIDVFDHDAETSFQVSLIAQQLTTGWWKVGQMGHDQGTAGTLKVLLTVSERSQRSIIISLPAFLNKSTMYYHTLSLNAAWCKELVATWYSRSKHVLTALPDSTFTPTTATSTAAAAGDAGAVYDIHGDMDPYTMACQGRIQGVSWIAGTVSRLSLQLNGQNVVAWKTAQDVQVAEWETMSSVIGNRHTFMFIFLTNKDASLIPSNITLTWTDRNTQTVKNMIWKKPSPSSPKPHTTSQDATAAPSEDAAAAMATGDHAFIASETLASLTDRGMTSDEIQTFLAAREAREAISQVILED
jgi:hypothetical protein